MDKAKKMLGVVTMLYEDYFFLERWYDYYSKQVGAENLYVFSHGNDPKHREIAKDANVMNLPRDVSMFKFDRRRWRMMSHLASGLLDYYNWMIVTDVDEIVVVDNASIQDVSEALLGDGGHGLDHVPVFGVHIAGTPGCTDATGFFLKALLDHPEETETDAGLFFSGTFEKGFHALAELQGNAVAAAEIGNRTFGIHR